MNSKARSPRCQSAPSKAGSVGFETLIAQISARFLNLPAHLVNGGIEAAQHEVCQQLDLDISTLWQWSPATPETFELTHYYRRFDGPPIPARMSANEHFPWSMRQMIEGRLVALPSLAGMPPGSERDREMLRHFGIKSALFLPLSTGGRPTLGALCFETVEREHAWPAVVVTRLQVVAQVFANALARKSFEERLLESEQQLNLAADAADAGLWSLNIPTGVYWVTPAVRRFFDFAPAETVTHAKVLARIHPEDRSLVNAAIESVLRSSDKGLVEYRLVRPDGSVRWLSSQGRILPGRAGEPDRLMGVSIDITGRKKAAHETAILRQQLAHLGRVALVNQLSSSLAHEMSQPLTAILANMHVAFDALARPRPDLPAVRPILEDVFADTRRACDIINRSRGWLKKDEPCFRAHDLNALIEETLLFLRGELMLQGVECTFEPDPQLPAVRCDRLQIQQVIANLLKNAWESRSEHLRPGHVAIRTCIADDCHVELSIHDDGCGIPDDVLDHLFQPFVSTKPRGLGVGLSICHAIIENHRGRIRAANNTDHGATFQFTLPIAPPPTG